MHFSCYQASVIINRVEQYLSNHPNITVIDPLDNVRILLNRYVILSYTSLLLYETCVMFVYKIIELMTILMSHRIY